MIRRAGGPIVRATCFPTPGSGAFRNSSAARSHDDVALLVIPAVAEVEFNRRRTALLKNLLQFRLVVLFENLDRADVIAEDAGVPFVAIEIGDWNTGVVLNDGAAMVENEIADAAETFLKHQIGR